MFGAVGMLFAVWRVFETCSLCSPGGKDQSWHSDVSPIFHEKVIGQDKHLPPMGIVVAAPLQDMKAIHVRFYLFK